MYTYFLLSLPYAVKQLSKLLAVQYLQMLAFFQRSFRIHFQMMDADFNIKEKINQILVDGGYDKMRARTMDIDDFLG